MRRCDQVFPKKHIKIWLQILVKMQWHSAMGHFNRFPNSVDIIYMTGSVIFTQFLFWGRKNMSEFFGEYCKLLMVLSVNVRVTSVGHCLQLLFRRFLPFLYRSGIRRCSGGYRWAAHFIDDLVRYTFRWPKSCVFADCDLRIRCVTQNDRECLVGKVKKYVESWNVFDQDEISQTALRWKGGVCQIRMCAGRIVAWPAGTLMVSVATTRKIALLSLSKIFVIEGTEWIESSLNSIRENGIYGFLRNPDLKSNQLLIFPRIAKNTLFPIYTDTFMMPFTAMGSPFAALRFLVQVSNGIW